MSLSTTNQNLYNYSIKVSRWRDSSAAVLSELYSPSLKGKSHETLLSWPRELLARVMFQPWSLKARSSKGIMKNVGGRVGRTEWTVSEPMWAHSFKMSIQYVNLFNISTESEHCLTSLRSALAQQHRVMEQWHREQEMIEPLCFISFNLQTLFSRFNEQTAIIHQV